MRAVLVCLLFVSCSSAQRTSVTLPPYTREVLRNGTVVCLIPKHDAPLLDLEVVIRAGSESDPPELAGLSSVVAWLLQRGAGAWTPEAFADEVDEMGASIAASTDPQATRVSAEVMPEYANQAIDLLAEAIIRPSFPEDETRKLLERRIEAARLQKDSISSAAWQYFRSFFFGPHHPYARPPWGDAVTLARITRQDISDYHTRMYVGPNVIVVAAGAFAPLKMQARLAAAFGRVPPGRRYPWAKEPPLSSRKGNRLLLVDKPDATQTCFRIGFPGIYRTHPDRLAVWLVNTVLGGKFTSLLNEELRVDSGLTYGAYSYWGDNRMTGAIVISSSTATRSTQQAIDLTLRVLRKFRRTGISPRQLAAAKAYIKGTYPPDNIQTTRQLAGLVGGLELYGLDRSEVDDLFARIDAITVDQANLIVRRYFADGDLTFVLVGNASRIGNVAARYAPEVQQMSIAEPGFALAEGSRRAHTGRQK